jgi:hypothetical protein
MSSALTPAKPKTELELKHEFAAALLKTPEDPFKAAFSVIPDVGQACEVATKWPNDSEVRAQQLRLIEQHGEMEFLPSKEQQCKDIYYGIAENKNIDVETRLKAHRLYAEMRSHIDKPMPAQAGMQVINQGIMVVRDHGTDDEWENKAVNQQRKLIEHAAS